ncbi:MAG: J domain-containing protein [Coriobacteriales bacterium]|jgi:hypothetical protein|nr:J domain-containing protein [Coriobacteriales bacterium]
MTRDEALRLLGLDEDATEADIKLAYKEMAQILHPDKYADNKKLAERATEQFKHVNEARELLLAAARGSRRGTSGGGGAAGRGARAGRGGAAGAGAGAAAGGRGSGSGGSSGSGSNGGPRDRVSALKARLAGIAAARVQLTAQLDTEVDRRRIGIYLLAGGLIGMLVGRVMRPLLAIAPVAIVWGGVQLFSSQANIKIINGHLAELEKGRKKCERELSEL